MDWSGYSYKARKIVRKNLRGRLVRMRSAVRIRPAAPLKALSPNGFKAFNFYKIPAPESFDYYLTTGAGFFCVSGVFLKDIFQSSDCLSISLLKCVCVDIECGGGLRVPHARRYGFNVQIAGDQQAGRRVAQPVERNKREPIRLRLAGIIADQYIAKCVIGGAVVHHPAIILDEYPVVPFPGRSPFEPVLCLSDPQFMEALGQKMRDRNGAV